MKLLLAPVVGVALFWVACSPATDNQPVDPTSVGRQGTADSIALGSNAGASCVEVYSLITLANRAFAFDGTVTEIEPAEDESPGSLSYAHVTFEVHEWFRPSGPDRVTVEMSPPGYHSTLKEADYAIGSRLLLSGESRWGGAPLDDPIVWSCGFSRTYTTEAAAAWDQALS